MNPRSNSFVVTVACSIFLIGCIPYTEVLHEVQFVGSTQNLDGQNFFYVAFGVSGSASYTYDVWGGGALDEGLSALAKRDLMLNHPLGPNQFYANFSIDTQRKESGTQQRRYISTRSLTEIEYILTVSADILELGSPPQGYDIPKPTPPKQFLQKIEKGDRVNYAFGEETLEGVVLTHPKNGEVKIFIYSTKERVWVSENSLTKSK